MAETACSKSGGRNRNHHGQRGRPNEPACWRVRRISWAATGFETPHVNQRMTSCECQGLGETDLRVQAGPATPYGLLTAGRTRRAYHQNFEALRIFRTAGNPRHLDFVSARRDVDS